MMKIDKPRLVLYCASVLAMGVSGWRMTNLDLVKAGGGQCCSTESSCWDSDSGDFWHCVPTSCFPCSGDNPGICATGPIPPC